MDLSCEECLSFSARYFGAVGGAKRHLALTYRAMGAFYAARAALLSGACEEAVSWCREAERAVGALRALAARLRRQRLLVDAECAAVRAVQVQPHVTACRTAVLLGRADGVTFPCVPPPVLIVDEGA